MTRGRAFQQRNQIADAQTLSSVRFPPNRVIPQSAASSRRYGLQRFPGRPCGHRHRDPRDAADRAVVDLAADPVRRHRAGGDRRGRRLGAGAPAVRPRRGDDGMAGLSAARGPRADRQFRGAGLHPADRASSAPASKPRSAHPRTYLLGRREQPRHRLGGDRDPRQPDPQPLHQPRRRGDGLDHRRAQHHGPARRHGGGARFRARSCSAASVSRRC